MGENICASKWSISIDLILRDQAKVLAKDAPVKSGQSRPGPLVNAIKSISDKDIFF